MNFCQTFGRIARMLIAIGFLYTAVDFIQESLVGIKVVEIAKKIEGEFSLEFKQVGVILALNDSTLVLKVKV